MAGEKKNPYAGRWVARVRERIIAQGGTPEQAYRAAKGMRIKDNPEIIFMPPIEPLIFSPLLESIRTTLPDGLTVFLVGGAVRDALLGRQTHDLDFALSKGAIHLARRVADSLHADFYPLDPERDTGRVIFTAEDGSRTVMDFAAFRGPDLESDLNGRDFTVNAIAMNLRSGEFHDPLGGGMDLKEKRLRACSPKTFTDDPVRILRGIRLAAAFGLHILPEARQKMKDAAALLPNVSVERLRDELFRILEGPQPATSLRALDLLGALEKVLPEIPALKGIEQPAPHVHDVWMHTLATVQHLESILAMLAPSYNPEKASNLLGGLLVSRLGRYRQQLAGHFARGVNINRSLQGLLYLAALYHDIAKPFCKKVDETGQLRFWDHDQEGARMAQERARLLALSNDEMARLEVIIRNHMCVLFHTNRLVKEGKQPSPRAIYRFFRDTGPAGVDVILLALADMRATYENTLPQDTWVACLDVCRLMLEAWWEKREERVTPPPLVDGNDLMRELSIRPGPLIGKLLEVIREAQVMGDVTTRAQALEIARKNLEQKV